MDRVKVPSLPYLFPTNTHSSKTLQSQAIDPPVAQRSYRSINKVDFHPRMWRCTAQSCFV